MPHLLSGRLDQFSTNFSTSVDIHLMAGFPWNCLLSYQHIENVLNFIKVMLLAMVLGSSLTRLNCVSSFQERKLPSQVWFLSVVTRLVLMAQKHSNSAFYLHICTIKIVFVWSPALSKFVWAPGQLIHCFSSLKHQRWHINFMAVPE